MNIQFVTNFPCSKSTLSNAPIVNAKSSPIKKKTSLGIHHIPSVYSSDKSDLSSSLSSSPAPDETHLVNGEHSLNPPSLVDHSSTNSSFAPSSQKVSSAWRKTFDDYFKSDDESSILSSDDEWWLGSRKPIIDRQEPPSGKTRLPERIWKEKLRDATHDDHNSDLDSTSSPEDPEFPSLTHDSTSEIASSPPSQGVPTLSNLNFPPLKSVVPSQPQLQSEPTPLRESSWVKPPPASNVPWSMTSSCKNVSSTPDFPPLTSSSAQKLPSRSAPRLICSFSSACLRSSEAKTSDAPLVMQSERASKKTLANTREESLKSSLPAFKLHDSFYSPLTISLCPSPRHPLSELPNLINSVCNDGIPLPSGKAEIEGGPYTAVAFDMEWEISYIRGHENKTALIQIASRSQALIIQLSSIGPWHRDGIMPQCLTDFLTDPQIVKLGVGIRNDGLKLLRDHKYGPKPYLNSFLELSRLTRSLGPLECATGYSRLISLQRIVADHLKVYLPKDIARKSDWNKPLSLAQLDYAASDVIATVRVAQRIFRLFQEKLKSKTSQLILDFIESLEPTLQRDQTPRPPVVSSSREWMTIQPPSKDLNKRLTEDSPQRQSIDALKTKVSPRVKQAWELWYHQGLSVENCAKKMKIKPTSVAIYLGKMLIHFNLNSMTLNDYVFDKLKTDQLYNDVDRDKIAREPADIGEMKEAPHQTDTKLAASNEESEFPQKLPEVEPESNILKGTTTAIEKLSEVNDIHIRVMEMTRPDLEITKPIGEADLNVTGPIREEYDELYPKNLVNSTLSDGPLPEKDDDKAGAANPDVIETENQECVLSLALRDVIHTRELNPDTGTVAKDSSISLNASIGPAESSADPVKQSDSLADRLIDPSEATRDIKSASTESMVNLPFESSETSLGSNSGIESKVTNSLDEGETNRDVVPAPGSELGCMDSPIEPFEISLIPGSETGSTEQTGLHVDNSTEKNAPHADQAYFDPGTESTDQISCINPSMDSHDSSVLPQREVDPVEKSLLNANLNIGIEDSDQVDCTNSSIELLKSASIPNNETHLTEQTILHIDETKLGTGKIIAEQIVCMNPPIQSPENSYIPAAETDPVEKSALDAGERNLDVGIVPADETEPAAKLVLDAGEQTLESGKAPSDQSGCVNPPIEQLESRLDPEKELGPSSRDVVPSESNPDIGSALGNPSIHKLPMKMFQKSKMKIESKQGQYEKGCLIDNQIIGDHNFNQEIDKLNKSKMANLKSLILKFHVHETLKVNLKTFGFA